MIFFILDTNIKDLNTTANCIREVYKKAKVIKHFNPATIEYELDRIKPDYLIIEVQLGNINGLSIAKDVKNRYPPIKVVITSDSKEYTIDAWKLHVNNYLIKPITSEKIREYL